MAIVLPRYVDWHPEPASPGTSTFMNQHHPAVRLLRPSAARLRAGLSLVEVMCAMIVIVVALLTAIGQMQVVNNTTTSAADQARVQEIGRSLLDRIVGANPTLLGTPSIQW